MKPAGYIESWLVSIVRPPSILMVVFQTGTETSAEGDWLKVDYILELAEWLYCNEQPVRDAVDLLHWAIEILLNMQFDVQPWEMLKTDGIK